MKNVNIMGVHQFLGEGVTKKQYIWGLPKKGGLGNLQVASQKIGRMFFRGGLIPR